MERRGRDIANVYDIDVYAKLIQGKFALISKSISSSNYYETVAVPKTLKSRLDAPTLKV